MLVFLYLFLVGDIHAAKPLAYQEIERAITEAGLFHRKIYQGSDVNQGMNDLEYLNRLAKISNLINRYWSESEHQKEEFATFLELLWDGKIFGEYLVIDHPMVKLPITLKLGEAIKVCLIESDMSKYRAYVDRFLHHKDHFILTDAIKAIGSVGSDKDVAYLSGIVKKELDGTSEQAVISLELLQSLKSIEALVRLREEVHRPSLKEFIDLRLMHYDENYRGVVGGCCLSNTGYQGQGNQQERCSDPA